MGCGGVSRPWRLAAFGYVQVKPGKRHKTRDTFGHGRGVYLTDEIRQSAAYRVLSPTEKLVLMDFIRKYYRASSGDKTDIRGAGFAYTFQDTLETVDAKTFYRARGRICAVGFFIRDDSLKRLQAGAVDVFIPSEGWRTFTPDTEAARRMESQAARKVDYIERGKERKRQFNRRRGGVNHE